MTERPDVVAGAGVTAAGTRTAAGAAPKEAHANLTVRPERADW